MTTANSHWLERLQMLMARYSHIGIASDIASLSLVDAWGLYLRLNRLNES